MSNQLGPLVVVCDAPPYEIVQACNIIGMETPEDVRWCNLKQHRYAQAGWRQLVQFNPWNVFQPGGNAGEGPCNCGHMLRPMENYVFTLPTGEELGYGLVQCERCKTVYWTEN